MRLPFFLFRFLLFSSVIFFKAVWPASSFFASFSDGRAHRASAFRHLRSLPIGVADCCPETFMWPFVSAVQGRGVGASDCPSERQRNANCLDNSLLSCYVSVSVSVGWAVLSGGFPLVSPLSSCSFSAGWTAAARWGRNLSAWQSCHRWWCLSLIRRPHYYICNNNSCCRARRAAGRGTGKLHSSGSCRRTFGTVRFPGRFVRGWLSYSRRQRSGTAAGLSRRLLSSCFLQPLYGLSAGRWQPSESYWEPSIWWLTIVRKNDYSSSDSCVVFPTSPVLSIAAVLLLQSGFRCCSVSKRTPR